MPFPGTPSHADLQVWPSVPDPPITVDFLHGRWMRNTQREWSWSDSTIYTRCPDRRASRDWAEGTDRLAFATRVGAEPASKLAGPTASPQV
jgi:hypothetical protein